MTQPRGQIVTDKILDTAERLFYGQGYGNTGINQVIDESGIAKASLYKHFDSKVDLLIAYIRRTHQRWFLRLETTVNAVADPKGKLLSLFDHHLERQELRKYGGCPFIKANDEAGSNEPRVLAVIQETKSQYREYIKRLVAGSGHRKLLSDRELADTIYIMLEGAVTAGAVFKTPAELQAAKKIIKKLI